MQQHVGEDFRGVVTGITNFGIFVQLDMYLVDGLIRYEDMGNDYWQVDERSGSVHGRSTNVRISIGDVVTARIVKVDLPRRELSLAITELRGRGGKPPPNPIPATKSKKHRKGGKRRPEKSMRSPKPQTLKRNRRRHE